MDINQVMGELDALFDEEKTGLVGSFLEEHIEQAAAEPDDEALLVLYNEAIGYFRETGQYDKAVSYCHEAVELIDKMELQGTIPYATTLLNVANAHRAAGLLDESLEYYNRAQQIYDALLEPDDMYYAGLYNNMSLSFQEMNDFRSAKEYLEKALDIVIKKEDRQFETAVTHANLANTCIELGEDDEAKARAEEAIRIFEEISVDDAHYSAALSALGSLYYMDKNYKEACEAMEKSRDCVAKYLGTENVQYQRLSENIDIIRAKLEGEDKQYTEPLQDEALAQAEWEEPLQEEKPSQIEWEEPLEKEETPQTEWEEPLREEEPSQAEGEEPFQDEALTQMEEIELPQEEAKEWVELLQDEAPSQVEGEEPFQEEDSSQAEGEEPLQDEALTQMEGIELPQEEAKEWVELLQAEAKEKEAFLQAKEKEGAEALQEEEKIETEPPQEVALTQTEEAPMQAEETESTSEEQPYIEESNSTAINYLEDLIDIIAEVQEQSELKAQEQSELKAQEQPEMEAQEQPECETQEYHEVDSVDSEDTQPVIEAEPEPEPELEDLTPEITGLELCRRYYEEYGAPMIAEKFPEYEGKIAVGLVGKGSDCFGFDDKQSADHDFGPRFVMWLTKESYEHIGADLQKEYEALPATFMGYERNETVHSKERSGVMIIEDFYKNTLGFNLIGRLGQHEKKKGLDIIKCWLAVHDHTLSAAVNGEVFRDDEGIFTKYRSLLLEYYPKAVWYRKIAQACAMFSQNGQYNLPRMRRRGQFVAAEMAKAECMKYAMKLTYLLNKKYSPHDKWLFKGLPDNSEMYIESDDGAKTYVNDLLQRMSFLSVSMKDEQELTFVIEALAVIFANELERLGIIGRSDVYLDANTGELTAKSDALLTAMMSETPMITALSLSIAKAEFEAFDKVQNEGGRASCQNDWPTFKVMRMSQYMTWNEDMLLQYLYEFKTNYANGRNMIEEKYARMMSSTAPMEYAEFADRLPVIPEEKRNIIEGIVELQVSYMEEFAQKYPKLAENARVIRTINDLPYDTSYETYLRGELSTYSDKMLDMYGRYIVEHAQKGKNIAQEIMENTIHFYGYNDLETANEKGL